MSTNTGSSHIEASPASSGLRGYPTQGAARNARQGVGRHRRPAHGLDDLGNRSIALMAVEPPRHILRPRDDRAFGVNRDDPGLDEHTDWVEPRPNKLRPEFEMGAHGGGAALRVFRDPLDRVDLVGQQGKRVGGLLPQRGDIEATVSRVRAISPATTAKAASDGTERSS